jgi:hypothetical protein
MTENSSKSYKQTKDHIKHLYELKHKILNFSLIHIN